MVGDRWKPGLLAATVVLAWAGACRNTASSDESAAAARALTVGTTKLAITPPLKVNDESIGQDARVACNAGGVCLAAWVQHFGSAPYLVARRFNQSGPVDDLTIVLAGPNPIGGIAVAARATGDFMVGWKAVVDNRIELVRINATTGAVIDSPPLAITDTSQMLARIVAVDDTYVVFYVDFNATNGFKAARVQAGVVRDAPGIAIGPYGTTNYVGYAAGPGQVAIANAAGMVRLSVTTGTVLDAAPIAYNKFAVLDDSASFPAVVFDGSNYIAIWYHDTGMWALRVRASDGAVLDPPDTFNERTGAHLIATGGGARPAAFFDGVNVIAIWTMSSGLVGVRVNTGGTRVQGAPTTAYEFVVATSVSTLVLSDFRGGFGLAAWTRGFDGVVGVSLSGAAGAVPAAAPISISFGGVELDGPSVASNGRDFLLSYRDHRTDAIRAVVVDGASGAVSAPILVGPFNSASLYLDGTKATWTGSAYLVTWREGNNLLMRTISCGGQVQGTAPVVVGPGTGEHATACNGERCAIVWRGPMIAARRLNADGSFIDTTPIIVSTVSDGIRGPVIAADSQPPAAMRTFLITWWEAGEVVARRLRADLGAVTAATAVAAVRSSIRVDLQVTSDGRQFFVSWYDGGDETVGSARIRGTPVDALSGLPTLAVPIEIGVASGGLGSLTFDGSSFVAFWYREQELRGGRISPTGTKLDGDGFLVDLAGVPLSHSVGGAPFGRSLAAFLVQDVPSFSHLYHGRFIDSELGPGVSGRAPSCGSGGTGGGGGGGMGGGGTGGTGAGGTGGAAGALAGRGGSGTAGTLGGAGAGGASGAPGGRGGSGAAGSSGSGGMAGSPAGGIGGAGAAGASGAGGISGSTGGSGAAGAAGAGGAAAGGDAGSGDAGAGGAAAAGQGGRGGGAPDPALNAASQSGCGCGLAEPAADLSPNTLSMVIGVWLVWRVRHRRSGRRSI